MFLEINKRDVWNKSVMVGKSAQKLISMQHVYQKVQSMYVCYFELKILKNQFEKIICLQAFFQTTLFFRADIYLAADLVNFFQGQYLLKTSLQAINFQLSLFTSQHLDFLAQGPGQDLKTVGANFSDMLQNMQLKRFLYENQG